MPSIEAIKAEAAKAFEVRPKDLIAGRSQSPKLARAAVVYLARVAGFQNPEIAQAMDNPAKNFVSRVFAQAAKLRTDEILFDSKIVYLANRLGISLEKPEL